MKIFFKKLVKKMRWEWQNRSSFTFRMDQKVHRWFIGHSANPNPDSLPYISGDTFRAIAKHVLDESSIIDPAKVETGNIVFVKIYFIEEFFKTIHPGIRNPYVLITHNGDTAVDDKLAQNIDEEIIHWYGQNVTTNNPKVIPIPIGLENMDYCSSGVVSRMKKAQDKTMPKKNRILFGFEVGTNPKERAPALEALLENPNADKIQGRITPKEHLKKLIQYKFVASPPGNGIDCHRTWEAMYVKTIPIVKDSLITRYFHSLGLPLYIVKDWNELHQLDEKALAEIYEKLSPKFSNPALYFCYWQDIIMATQ